MPLFHSRKVSSKRVGAQLAEDFRRPDRVPAEYFFSVEGMELTGDSCRRLLKEFSRDERPLLALYLPDELGEEAAHHFLVRKLRRYTLSLSDLSPNGEGTSFLREHARVRFGFEHNHETYFFETRVLGGMGEEETVLLAEKPETIYQERRSLRRYWIWPDHQAFLGWMQVHDISWNGLRILCETSLESGDILENAQLSLPRVHDPESGVCLHFGGRIHVPRARVIYSQAREDCSCYGVYFEREWEEGKKQALADFLFALRKPMSPLSKGL
ncbi:MAG: hypothetical protein K9J48_05325 [Desulfohalobiaceae bacterium]|nr:hypothetical protein [Desulfohalobiaceae bacterium]